LFISFQFSSSVIHGASIEYRRMPCHHEISFGGVGIAFRCGVVSQSFVVSRKRAPVVGRAKAAAEIGEIDRHAKGSLLKHFLSDGDMWARDRGCGAHDNFSQVVGLPMQQFLADFVLLCVPANDFW
jgi:hypothetical protein